MITTEAPVSAITASRSGSRSPVVSLITAAPAATLRAATSGRNVSTDITTSLTAATAATTGTTRSSSSASLTSAASGENGTPPMSTQPAPAASAASAAATARSRAYVSPWS